MSRTRPWPWPRLDHATAAVYLEGHLPRSDASLEPAGRGDFCLAFRLGDAIVRLARHAEAAAALRREACVMAEIAPHLPLTVPRPTYEEPDDCPPFAVHEAVPGEVLTRDAWRALPASQSGEIARRLAEFLHQLHARPAAIGTACGLPKAVAESLAEDLRSRVTAGLGGRLEPQRLDRLVAWLGRVAARPPEAGTVALLHCDIAPGHILWSPAEARLTGVIDFGDLALGEPARDFVFIYEDFGTAILEEVLGHYPCGDPAAFRGGIRAWYLLEAVSWTLDMVAAGRDDQVVHGLGEIERELEAKPRD